MSKIKGKYIDFNDTGTGTTDVWSADKIISYVDAFNPFDQDLNTTDDVEFNTIETDKLTIHGANTTLIIQSSDESRNYMEIEEVSYSHSPERSTTGLIIKGGAVTDDVYVAYYTNEPGIILQAMQTYNSTVGELNGMQLLSVRNYSGDEKFALWNDGDAKITGGLDISGNITYSGDDFITINRNYGNLQISSTSTNNIDINSGENSNTIVHGGTGIYSSIIGSQNTILGANVELANFVDGCVLLGNETKATASNQLIIDNTNTTSPLIYGEFDNDYLKINGDLETTGTLDATGAVDFNSTLNVDGAVDFNSTLTIDGLTTIYNNLDVQDDLDVGGTITGNVTGNLTGNVTGDLTGATTVGGYLTLNSRLLLHESTIGNAADVALGSGNMFSPTYSSLNRISSSSWTTGSVIYLVFTGSCTVSSSATASGSYKGLRLAGTTAFSAKAGDTLTLIYDGTYWRETSRMVS